MPLRLDMPTFAGLEIGAELRARLDTAKYRTALRKARNVLGRTAGGVSNRQGFEFVGEIYDSTKAARLLPFSFSVDQTYVLPFEDGGSRVVTKGGFVLETELVVTGISNAVHAVVLAVAHGYSIGDDIFFSGVTGMTEINGLYARVIAVTANSYTLDLDTTEFGVFTGCTGGIAGDVLGGVGGAAPVDPDAPTPDPPPYVPPDPPPLGGGIGGGGGGGGGFGGFGGIYGGNEAAF